MLSKGVGWVIFLLFVFSLTGGIPAQTQAAVSADTVTPAITPTPEPTQPPAILVIEPTPITTPAPEGNLLQQVWDEYKLPLISGLIAAILAGIVVGVWLKRMAEKIADLTSQLFHKVFDRISSSPLVRWRYEREYRATLAEKMQDLEGGRLVEHPIRLDKMYVPSLLTRETRVEVPVEFSDRFQWEEDRRRKQLAHSVKPWEALEKFHRFVVLGGPGIGKTTYLYHLAFMCAKREKTQFENYLPIFIRFREIVDDIHKIEQLEELFPKALAANHFPNAQSYIQRQLDSGRALILLDGLDEISDDSLYRRLLDLVQNFADRYVQGKVHKGNRNLLVVSSRTFSYRHGKQLEDFPLTEVMKFDSKAIEIFVHNWFATPAQRPLADGLMAELRRNPRFLELARTPLLLVLIAFHYGQERSLPQLRADLYQECIATRIARWNEKRGTHLGRFGKSDKLLMLQDLALAFYRQEWGGLIEESQLLTWLREFSGGVRFPDGATEEDLLEEIARDSGLLKEWAIERYGFSHQTLQEYFAAEAIRNEGPEEGAALLLDHVTERAWKEIIRLYAGRVSNANPLLQGMVQKAEYQLEPKNLWLLSSDCLEEGARSVDSSICQQVFRAQFELLHAVNGDRGALSSEESADVVRQLRTLAVGELPGYVRTLLESGTSQDALLAARLFPEGLDTDLSAEISQRVTELARSGADEERRAASVALGWVGQASDETIDALLDELRAREASARAEAARALGRIGARNEDVAAALLLSYNTDPEDATRHAALEALLALDQAEAVGMALIPAGEFLMGSTDKDKDADSDEKTQHSLYLPAYYMDLAPVTNTQYRRFMEADGYRNPAYWNAAIDAEQWKDGAFLDPYNDDRPTTQPRYWTDEKWNQPDHPVVGVSWYEALAYTHWAGKRLPTEAEWEKAARGTDGRIYPWGDEPPTDQHCNFNNKVGATTPVGQYPPGNSPFDLVDMAGNVREWCSTRWDHNYPYDPNDGREDLSGGANVSRIMRGGAWSSKKKWVRCAYRPGLIPRNRRGSRGFRCCCAPSSLTSSGS